MAENVLKLKKQAVELGMPRNDALKATRLTLEKFIAESSKSKPKVEKSAKKKTKVAAEKPVAKSKKKTAKPKAEKVSKSASSKKKSPAVKSTKVQGKAKRTSKVSDDEAGRNVISSLDWNAESDFWNPREGGATERMFKVLKKAKGNIDKAFEAIVGEMFDFVGKKKRNGEKRTKAEAEAMLRYRLNRTKYEFATRTGQHESATNRIEYGSGNGKTAKPKAKVEKPKVKAAATKTKKTSKKTKTKK